MNVQRSYRSLSERSGPTEHLMCAYYDSAEHLKGACMGASARTPTSKNKSAINKKYEVVLPSHNKPKPQPAAQTDLLNLLALLAESW